MSAPYVALTYFWNWFTSSSVAVYVQLPTVRPPSLAIAALISSSVMSLFTIPTCLVPAAVPVLAPAAELAPAAVLAPAPPVPVLAGGGRSFSHAPPANTPSKIHVPDGHPARARFVPRIRLSLPLGPFRPAC